MQNAVIGIIVGASFICLTLLAAWGRRRSSGIGAQVALGTIVGAVAAGIAVSVRADLIPDDVEAAVAIAAVLAAACALIAVLVRHEVQ